MRIGRRVVHLITAALACTAAACTPKSVQVLVISGQDAGAFIDARAGDFLAARYAGVPIGSARCPTLVVLTGDRTVECTIPIGDRGLRIDITAPDRFHPELIDRDALLVRDDVERSIARSIALAYGVRFIVRCDIPDVSILPIESEVPCTGSSPGGGQHPLDVRVIRRDGEMTTPHLPGYPPALERALGAEITNVKHGGVRFPGRRLEPYLRDQLTAENPGLAELHLVRAARCPAVIAVDETRRTSCRVEAGSASVRYDVRFDLGLGLVIWHEGAAVSVPAVRETAQRVLARLFPRLAEPPVTRVTCGEQPVVVLQPGSDLPCVAWYRGGRVPFTIRIINVAGEFDLYPGVNRPTPDNVGGRDRRGS